MTYEQKLKAKNKVLTVVVCVFAMLITVQTKQLYFMPVKPRVISDRQVGNLHYVRFSYLDTAVVDSMDERKYHLLLDSVLVHL